MPEQEQNGPVRKSPFWRFSVKFYAVPGVAPACIELQDRAKVDVNVLFFLLWNATQKRALGQAEVAELDRMIGAWRDMTVIPMREVRRALKSPPPVMAAEAAEGFRTRIKAGRTGSRAAAAGGDVRPRAVRPLRDARRQPAEAARASVEAYQALLRPLPGGGARCRAFGICKVRNAALR